MCGCATLVTGSGYGRDRCAHGKACTKRLFSRGSDGLAPDEAARRVGVSVASWRRYASETLVRDRGGRRPRRQPTGAMWASFASPPPETLSAARCAGRGSARCWPGMQTPYVASLKTEDASGLDEFRGKRVAGLVLETDVDQLEDLALEGGVPMARSSATKSERDSAPRRDWHSCGTRARRTFLRARGVAAAKPARFCSSRRLNRSAATSARAWPTVAPCSRSITSADGRRPTRTRRHPCKPAPDPDRPAGRVLAGSLRAGVWRSCRFRSGCAHRREQSMALRGWCRAMSRVGTLPELVALRCHVEPPDWKPHHKKPRRPGRWPSTALVVHTVPVPSPGEPLWFGVAGFTTADGLRARMVFHRDGIPRKDIETLSRICKRDGLPAPVPVREFLEVVYRVAYLKQVPVVCVHLGATLARLAADWGGPAGARSSKVGFGWCCGRIRRSMIGAGKANDHGCETARSKTATARWST